MKYAIRVEETIGRTIIVEAENIEDAIEMVEDAANNDKILLDGIEDFVGREVKPSDVFEGGIVPDDRDVSYYEHLNGKIINAEFFSYWDGGIEVKTSCKVNTLTKEVFDIKQSSIEGLENCEGEHVCFDGIMYEVFQKDEAEIGEYWYE